MPPSSVQGVVELRDRFFDLLDSLSALKALAEIRLAGITEAQLLREALQALARHQSLERCSVFLLEGNQLHCVAGTEIDEERLRVTGEIPFGAAAAPSMTFAVGEGVTGLACQTGQLQYCRNCAEDARFTAFDDNRLGCSRGSLMCVPVSCCAEVLGVLNLSHPLPEFFQPWQQHMLLLFGATLGQTLYNFRLRHNLEGEADKRTLALQEALYESEELRRRYEELSTVDALTGLKNRRYFFTEGESILSRAVRYRLPFSLLLVDVDHFKRINDTWGHTLGDRVLRLIAESLCEDVRTGDIVARLGGEEFALVLPNTGTRGTDLLAMRIQERIAALDLGGEIGNIGITVSIGMTGLDQASPPEHDISKLLEVLYAQADRAMYRCKRQGRNRRMLYGSWMDAGAE